MKMICTLFLTAVALFSAFAASDLPSPEETKDWIPGPDATWMIHWDQAKQRAAEENRNILVLSTGSDWCGWCIKLRKDVFETGIFKAYAEKNLVLLWLDSPKKIRQPEAQKKHNADVRKTLRFGSGVPRVKLLSPDGTELRESIGYRDLSSFMKFLQEK